MFGSFFLMPLGDYYGRRTVLLIAGSMFYTLAIMTHPWISQSIYGLYVLMFFAGVFALPRST
jgi:hypothetical protein